VYIIYYEIARIVQKKVRIGVYGYGGSNGVTAIFVTLPEVTTKYMHSWVVGLRLDGNLVSGSSFRFHFFIITRGWGRTAPGDTLRGGDTRMKKNGGQIYKE